MIGKKCILNRKPPKPKVSEMVFGFAGDYNGGMSDAAERKGH